METFDMNERQAVDRQVVEVVEGWIRESGSMESGLDAGREKLSELDMARGEPARETYSGGMKIEGWRPVIEAISRSRGKSATREAAESEPNAAMKAYRRGCSRFTNGGAMALVEQARNNEESMHEGIAWAMVGAYCPDAEGKVGGHTNDAVRREARRILLEATQAGPQAVPIRDAARGGLARDVYADGMQPAVPLWERRKSWKLVKTVNGGLKRQALFSEGKSQWLEGKMGDRASNAGVGSLEGAAKLHEPNAELLLGVHRAMGSKGTGEERAAVDALAERALDELGADDTAVLYLAGSTLEEQGTTERHRDAADMCDETGRAMYCELAYARITRRVVEGRPSPEQARADGSLCEHVGYLLEELQTVRKSNEPEAKRQREETQGKGWLDEDACYPVELMERECTKMCRGLGLTLEQGMKELTGEELMQLRRRNWGEANRPQAAQAQDTGVTR